MSDEKIRTGLWKKDSNNGGAPYYGGKITVAGVEYWVNLYKNDRKEQESHPDLNLQLKPVEARGNAPQRQASTQRQPANRPHDDFVDDDLNF